MAILRFRRCWCISIIQSVRRKAAARRSGAAQNRSSKYSLGNRSRLGGGLDDRERFASFANFLPQFLAPGARLGGKGKNSPQRILVFKDPQRIAQRISRETVALGRHNDKGPASRS